VVDRGLDNPELFQNLVNFYGKFFGEPCDGHVSCFILCQHPCRFILHVWNTCEKKLKIVVFKLLFDQLYWINTCKVPLQVNIFR
jgi:hypothetical protein